MSKPKDDWFKNAVWTVRNYPARKEEYEELHTQLAELETRVKALCSRVTGVGEAEVMITLSGGFEYVYATDTRTAAGGVTTSYVTVGSGGGESLVFVTEKPPAIVGVGVVCAGGNDPAVRQEITSLLSAALGIGSNKIYVTGHK